MPPQRYSQVTLACLCFVLPNDLSCINIIPTIWHYSYPSPLRQVIPAIMMETPAQSVPGDEAHDQEQLDEEMTEGQNQKNTSQGTPFFFRLPVELVLNIVTFFFRPGDTVALSLTCKGLFNIIPALNFDFMTTVEQRDLLHRLERDLCATHYFCSRCTKLHVFKSNPILRIYDSCQHHGAVVLSSAFAPIVNWTQGARHLDFATARMLVNNLRYGPPDGLSVHDFCSNDWPRRSNNDTWVSRTTDRPFFETERWNVIMGMKLSQNDQLLLKATHTIRGDNCELGLRSDAATLHQLCEHTIVHRCYPLKYPGELFPSSMAEHRADLGLVLPELSIPWGCHCCASE
jgi:hypothetical protein